MFGAGAACVILFAYPSRLRFPPPPVVFFQHRLNKFHSPSAFPESGNKVLIYIKSGFFGKAALLFYDAKSLVFQHQAFMPPNATPTFPSSEFFVFLARKMMKISFVDNDLPHYQHH
jgi:hypothetical protein